MDTFARVAVVGHNVICIACVAAVFLAGSAHLTNEWSFREALAGVAGSTVAIGCGDEGSLARRHVYAPRGARDCGFRRSRVPCDGRRMRGGGRGSRRRNFLRVRCTRRRRTRDHRTCRREFSASRGVQGDRVRTTHSARPAIVTGTTSLLGVAFAVGVASPARGSCPRCTSRVRRRSTPPPLNRGARPFQHPLPLGVAKLVPGGDRVLGEVPHRIREKCDRIEWLTPARVHDG